jgi:transcriptional regulator with XRE-family HTH domain
LAEKLGYVTNSYISDVESGHFIPSREKLKKIANALNPFCVGEFLYLYY